MLTYTNRRGVTYHVHEARTKAGARRYVVKRTLEGALAELPAGMEIVESVNGQVSVRAARPGVILPLEERLVQQALARHDRDTYRVEVKDRDILIHAPDRDADTVARLLDPGRAMGVSGSVLDKLIRRQIGNAAWAEHRRQERQQARKQIERTMRYSPVLRFRLDDRGRRLFTVERMCYLGDGSWLGLQAGMPLAAACDRYLPLLGTEEIFEEF